MPLILMVDNDLATLEGVGRFVLAEGFELITCRNMPDALGPIDEKRPDLVLSEVMLPGRSGFELADHIRSKSAVPGVPIVLWSAVYRRRVHGTESKERYRLLEYFDKPIDTHRLKTVLKAHFGSRYPVPAPPDEGSPTAQTHSDPVRPNPPARPAAEDHLSIEVPLSGSFDRYPFPFILSHLVRNRLNGALLLVCDEVKKAVYLENGAIVAVTSNQAGECLGKMLLDQGVISEMAYRESVIRMRESGHKQGEVLVEMGALNQLALTKALKEQNEEKLLSIFSWPAARYQFKPLDMMPPFISPISRHPFTLIKEGIERRFTAEMIGGFLSPLWNYYLGRSPDAARLLEGSNLNLKEQRFLRGLDFGRTVGSLVDAAGDDRSTTTLLLFLISTGIALLRVSPLARTTDLAATYGTPDRSGMQPAPAAGGEPYVLDDDEPRPDRDGQAAAASGIVNLEGEVLAFYNNLKQFIGELEGKDYFDILGVTAETLPDEINRAYASLAKRFHPDSISFREIPEIRDAANSIFSLVTEAKNTLTNLQSRERYIKQRKGIKVDASDEVVKILNAEQKFLEGQRLLKAREYLKAKDLFDEARGLNPKEGEYYVDLGWSLFNINPQSKNGVEQAVQYIHIGESMTGVTAKSQFYLGEIYKEKGDIAVARGYFSKAAKLDKNHKQALSELRLLDMRDQQKKGLFSFLKK